MSTAQLANVHLTVIDSDRRSADDSFSTDRRNNRIMTSNSSTTPSYSGFGLMGVNSGYAGIGMMGASGALMNSMIQSSNKSEHNRNYFWRCDCSEEANSGSFCMKCGKKAPDGAPQGWVCNCGQIGNIDKFCIRCGKSISTNSCPNCGTKVDERMRPKFCQECGTRLR